MYVASSKSERFPSAVFAVNTPESRAVGQADGQGDRKTACAHLLIRHITRCGYNLESTGTNEKTYAKTDQQQQPCVSDRAQHELQYIRPLHKCC